MLAYAPGSRALIRDEEWLIRRADPTVDGGWLLTCDGISDLVRGKDALFLTTLEDKIEVLDPADTELVPDDSPTYNAALLYLESMRRRSVANDDKIHLGHRGVMNLVPYQLDPALQALRQPRSRILIADAVGLGKTLEAGVLTTELISARSWQAHPGGHAEGDAHPVPEGVVEPLLHPAGAAGLGGPCAGAKPHSGEPQPVQPLRRGALVQLGLAPVANAIQCRDRPAARSGGRFLLAASLTDRVQSSAPYSASRSSISSPTP